MVLRIDRRGECKYLTDTFFDGCIVVLWFTGCCTQGQQGSLDISGLTLDGRAPHLVHPLVAFGWTNHWLRMDSSHCATSQGHNCCLDNNYIREAGHAHMGIVPSLAGQISLDLCNLFVLLLKSRLLLVFIWVWIVIVHSAGHNVPGPCRHYPMIDNICLVSALWNQECVLWGGV